MYSCYAGVQSKAKKCQACNKERLKCRCIPVTPMCRVKSRKMSSNHNKEIHSNDTKLMVHWSIGQ